MSESVKMPALGESVTEGTVSSWLKAVGDTVEVDEPLVGQGDVGADDRPAAALAQGPQHLGQRASSLVDGGRIGDVEQPPEPVGPDGGRHEGEDLAALGQRGGARGGQGLHGGDAGHELVVDVGHAPGECGAQIAEGGEDGRVADGGEGDGAAAGPEGLDGGVGAGPPAVGAAGADAAALGHREGDAPDAGRAVGDDVGDDPLGAPGAVGGGLGGGDEDDAGRPQHPRRLEGDQFGIAGAHPDPDEAPPAAAATGAAGSDVGARALAHMASSGASPNGSRRAAPRVSG